MVSMAPSRRTLVVVLLLLACLGQAAQAQESFNESTVDQAQALGGAAGPRWDIRIKGFQGSPAQSCMECLTTAATLSRSNGGPQPWTYCSKACASVKTGDEYFWWKDHGNYNSKCEGTQATSCNRCRPNNEAACDASPCNSCCGYNIGMAYSLPPHSGTDELANFKKNCKDIEKETGSCTYTCELYNKANVDSKCAPLDGKDGFNGCIHLTEQASGKRSTLKRGDAHRYMIVPGVPNQQWGVIGIEDPSNQNNENEFILTQAWQMAFDPNWVLNKNSVGTKKHSDLPVAPNAANIGIAFNPATIRSEHQLHVHIGVIPYTIRNLLQPRGNFASWQSVKMPAGQTEESQSSATIKAYVKYFKIQDASGWTGPHKDNIFQQVLNFARGSRLMMEAWGVAIIPDEAPIAERQNAPGYFDKKPAGYYLIVSTNNQHGQWNNYSPQNPKWVPEWFLCTYYSCNPNPDPKNSNNPKGWWKQTTGNNLPGPGYDCPNRDWKY